MYNKLNADLLDEEYDFVVIHDPQPLAMRHFKGPTARNGSGAATSTPPALTKTFSPSSRATSWSTTRSSSRCSASCRRASSTRSWQSSRRPSTRSSPKNVNLPDHLCREILVWLGVKPDKPLMTQVSRFDPWKDPFGVIEVYRKVREEVPGLQLALLGSMALDDPEGWGIYNDVVAETKNDADITSAPTSSA